MNSEDTTSRKQRSTNLEIPLDIATSGRPRRQSTGIAAFLCRVLPPEGSERKPPKTAFNRVRVRVHLLLLHRTHRQAPDAPPPAARGCPALSPPLLHRFLQVSRPAFLASHEFRVDFALNRAPIRRPLHTSDPFEFAIRPTPVRRREQVER